MSVKLRKRKRAEDKYSLFLDIYHQGNRKTEYLNLYLTNNKSQNRAILELAEKQRAKRELELQYENFGFVSDSKKKENFVDYFDRQVKERPADRSSWTCTLKKLEEYSGGYIRFDHVTPEWLQGLQAYFLKQVSQLTAFYYYSNIMCALNSAVREKIIATNPGKLIKGMKKPETKREYLLLEEIKKLISTECGNNEVKDAFIFSCFTGLRYSDLKNLKWESIVENRIEFRQQKTKSLEYLPLSKTAFNILEKRRSAAEAESIIFNIPTKVVTWDHIKKWVKKAEINKRVSFHTSRHTFATLSLTQGIDLYTVSKLLGHKDIATTQIYAKVIDSKRQEAVNKLPLLEF